MAAITLRGNDYVIKAKRNQPRLYSSLFAAYSCTLSQRKHINLLKASRGRNSHRQVQVFTPPPDLDMGWRLIGLCDSSGTFWYS
ncbi:MAG: hypothetical protein F6K65_25455 [Moorea sp. SIO3C2]|nr:hypothetical protein [Moorena sp. SIO3C2]